MKSADVGIEQNKKPMETSRKCEDGRRFMQSFYLQRYVEIGNVSSIVIYKAA
jgi:hypothetical protein